MNVMNGTGSEMDLDSLISFFIFLSTRTDTVLPVSCKNIHLYLFLHFFLCLNLLCSLFCVFIYISNIVFILLSCVNLAALTIEINKVYIILYNRAYSSLYNHH